MALPETEFLLDFFVALGVGSLIGIEREHRGDQTRVIAGVRTFPLFSLSGFMIGVIAIETAEPILMATGVLVAGAVSLAFLLVRHNLGTHGFTTPMAMFVTFLLGALIAYGMTLPAVIVGVATTFLLLTKKRLHRFANALRDDEILGALQFVTLLFILFPIAGATTPPVAGQDWIGRGALVDPFTILLVAVFVSGISFASFVVMRVVGPRRGLEVSGLLGGLVNSEATSVSLATQSRAHHTLLASAKVGVLLATATMFVRGLVILGFAAGPRAPEIVAFVLPSAAAGAIVLLAIALWTRVRAPAPAETALVELRNPFAVMPALAFAAIFAALAVATTLLVRYVGDWGVYATALGGFTYAGAVVASLGALAATGQIDARVAAQTAALALLAGAANKLFVMRHANMDLQKRVALPVGAAVVVGLAMLGASLAFL